MAYVPVEEGTLKMARAPHEVKIFREKDTGYIHVHAETDLGAIYG
jgi:hypothetical protein